MKNKIKTLIAGKGLVIAICGTTQAGTYSYLLVFTCMVLLTSTAARSETYYIDYINGLNTNNGLSKNAAWKVHPYMRGFTGTYTHQAGDRFVFKGGISWPNGCFRMYIPNGGTNDAVRDYYGVDSSWYSGGSWSRPVFDMQGAQTATYNQVMCFALDAASNISVDNIEVKGFYWSGSQAWGNCVVFNYTRNHNLTFKNIYVHNWSHDTYLLPNGDTTKDDLKVFLGYSSLPFDSNSVIEYCEFDGSSAGGTSGLAAYAGCAEFRYNKVHHMANGPITEGSPITNHSIHDNLIYNINNSYDPKQHMNALYFMGGGYVYNNVIYNVTGSGVMTLYLSPGFDGSQNNQYCYNNVVYEIHANNPGIIIDPEQIVYTGTVYVLNNTAIGGTGDVWRVVSRPYTVADVVVQNNHWITSGTPYDVPSGKVLHLTNNNNLIMSPAAATSQGYIAGNKYAPASGTCTTVDSGISQSSIFTTDIKGISRPQGSAWDIGAYEYVPGTAVTPSASDKQSLSQTNIRLRNAGFSVTFPLSVKSPELTIVDLSGRKVFHTMLNKTGEAVYNAAWHRMSLAGIFFAVVKEKSRNDGAVLSRTKVVVDR